jgi:hypothetical protein
MDLQNTFYVLGIIFMSLMLIIVVVLVVLAFVIRAKLTAIHTAIEEKLSLVASVAQASSAAFNVVKGIKQSVKTPKE